MSIHNNFPTISWIKLDGISVVKDEEVYIVKDFKTNLKYIFWSSDIPDQLTASNVMLSRTSSRFLIAINNKGECILVPNEEIVVSFDGNSVDAITEHIWGLYEKDEEYGDKFVSLEQNIEGITQTVGQTQEELGKVNEYVSKVDQKADSINLSVKEVQKEYTDDKEASELRENLNSAIIKINSNLGIFKSELTDYFKDNEMSNEEVEAVGVQLELLETSKINLDTYIDKVIYVAENNGHSEEAILLDSAKTSLDNIHTNLISTIENSIIDNIITSTEITVVIDAFARYSTKINEIKNTCDDIIILGMGGVITEELSRIDMLSDEIKLSVSKVETNFRDELESQGEDIQNIDKKYAEIVVNLEEGITSKIEHINTKIDGEGGIEHRLQSAEEKITPNSIVQVVKNSQTIKDIENEISYIDQRADSISLEVSKKVGQNSIISSINQTAEAIKINASKINLNGYVTVSDLGSSGTTTIHGDRIATGSIKVNNLSSNNENPIIRLFPTTDANGNTGYCSIDATKKYEQGIGDAIRLKWDSMNYIMQKRSGVEFYLEPREVNPAFSFQSDYGHYYDDYETRIATKDGVLAFRGSGGLAFYTSEENADRTLLTSYDITHSISSTSTRHVASAFAVKKAYDRGDSAYNLANTANTNANSALSKANSAYSLASGALYSSDLAGYINTSIYPGSAGSYHCGKYNNHWDYVVANTVCWWTSGGHAFLTEEKEDNGKVAYNFLKQYKKSKLIKYNVTDFLEDARNVKELSEEEQLDVINKIDEIYDICEESSELYTKGSVLTETIAEGVEYLIQKIETLENKISYMNELQNKNNELENRLAKLEELLLNYSPLK